MGGAIAPVGSRNLPASDEEARHLAGAKNMPKHAHVKHPNELIQEAKNRRRRDNRLLYYNDIDLEWLTNHVLASEILFDIALIVPLLTLYAPDTVIITLAVISSIWLQWRPFPAL